MVEACVHLNTLLPLKARQDALDAPLRAALDILRGFAATGAPPARGAGRLSRYP
jgi:hypothetical protein